MRAAHAQLALSLIDDGKLDSARNLLEHFDQNVLESNFPYGMTSNRGNQHNRISMSFLLACYQSDDLKLAAKVAASVRKDLEQQIRYYNSLGESQPNEQLAVNAQMEEQGKGGNLSDSNKILAKDILAAYPDAAADRPVGQTIRRRAGITLKGRQTTAIRPTDRQARKAFSPQRTEQNPARFVII